MVVRKISGYGFALCALAMPAFAQRPLPSDSVVQALIRQRVNEGRNTGIIVGLIDANGNTRVVAYGRGVGSDALNEQTVFEIGSVTKTFTAAILADMVEHKTVRLDQPVAELLPAGTIMPTRAGRQITLVDLATQSSGLPGMPDNLAPRDSANPYADYTGARMLAFLARYQLPRDIGSKYEYSNLGFGLLGYALASKAGISYERLVTERVLRPLGMTESAITLTPAMRARLAPGHDAAEVPVPLWDLDAFAGAGAIRSTMHDMLRYLRANIDPSASKIGAELASTHQKRFQTDQPAVSIGLAWQRLATASGDTTVAHNGGTAGYRSFIGFDPARRVGVVVLTNTSNPPDDIGIHLLDESFPLTPPPPSAVQHEITLSATALERFVGEYQIHPNFVIAITRDGEKLFAQATGQPQFQLFAEAPSTFFLKVVNAKIEFESDVDGRVSGLVLAQEGVRTPARKVK